MVRTIIRPQTGAESAGVEFKTFRAEGVLFVASGLATTEEVDIEIWNGQAFVPFRDSAGNIVTLTATAPMKTFPGGVFYRIKKDATAAPGGVVAYLQKNS